MLPAAGTGNFFSPGPLCEPVPPLDEPEVPEPEPPPLVEPDPADPEPEPPALPVEGGVLLLIGVLEAGVPPGAGVLLDGGAGAGFDPLAVGAGLDPSVVAVLAPPQADDIRAMNVHRTSKTSGLQRILETPINETVWLALRT